MVNSIFPNLLWMANPNNENPSSHFGTAAEVELDETEEYSIDPEDEEELEELKEVEE